MTGPRNHAYEIPGAVLVRWLQAKFGVKKMTEDLPVHHGTYPWRWLRDRRIRLAVGR